MVIVDEKIARFFSQFLSSKLSKMNAKNNIEAEWPAQCSHFADYRICFYGISAISLNGMFSFGCKNVK